MAGSPAGRQAGRLAGRLNKSQVTASGRLVEHGGQLPGCCPPPPPSLQVRKVINEFKVGAPARVGLVAPNDVTIPAGNTGMDPSQTSFFQVRAYERFCADRISQWIEAGQRAAD